MMKVSFLSLPGYGVEDVFVADVLCAGATEYRTRAITTLENFSLLIGDRRGFSSHSWGRVLCIRCFGVDLIDRHVC